MALSRVRYEQTVAGNRSFAVPFAYLRKEHVEVKADGVTIAFTWVDNQNILTDVAPIVGAVVLVKRVTPTDVQVDFTDGSTLTEKELDLAYLQNLYLAQERIDDAEDTMKIADDGHWDARNRRIKNVADPVAAQDAVTKAHLDARLQAIADLVSQLEAAVAAAEGFANDAAGYAQDAADQVALAEAQVALAEAQVALAAAQAAVAAGHAADAQGYADDAAAQVALAAAQVALAADQVAIAAGHAADAAGYAASAAAAQVAAEAAEDGAQAVLDEINDMITSGELGQYPGVNVNDPINQDMRKAWAALSATEVNGNFGGQFEDLTTGNAKSILHPGLNGALGKRKVNVATASPARLQWSGTGWEFSNHEFPLAYYSLNSDSEGRPILLIGSSEEGLVLGKLPGEYYVDPSSLGGNTVLPGYTPVGFAALKSIPYDSSGHASVYHNIMYDAIVNGATGALVGTGPDFFECIQEVTVEYSEDAAPTNRILRKFVRHVKGASDSSYYGENWQPVGSGGSSGPTNLTDSELKLFIPSLSNYFRQAVTGTSFNNGKLSISTNEGLEYQNIGGSTGSNREVFVGIREPGSSTVTCNKGLYVNGSSGSSSGNVYLDTQFASSFAGLNRISLSRTSGEVSTTIRNAVTTGTSSTVIHARSGSTSGLSNINVYARPIDVTRSFYDGTYLKAGVYSTESSNFFYASEPASYSMYKSSGGVSGPAKQIHVSRGSGTRNSGFTSASQVNAINFNNPVDGEVTYSFLYIYSLDKSSTGFGSMGFVQDSGAGVPGNRSLARTYSSRYQYESISPIVGVGSYELYLGQALAEADFSTSATYSNGLQGTGLSVFNAVTSGASIGIRLASRWANTSVNTAVGVLSSDHAGAPGETAGVAPLRFEQTLTAGGTTRVWTAANTTIGTDAQNPSAFNDTNKTLTSITRMGKNRKMITIRQRSLTPDINGIITITLPESYKNLISASFTQDQPDLLDLSSSSMYIPNSFSMSSPTSRSTVSLGFLEIDGGIVAIATSVGDCAGLITLVVEE